MDGRGSRIGRGSALPSWGPFDSDRDRDSTTPGRNGSGGFGGASSAPGWAGMGGGMGGGMAGGLGGGGLGGVGGRMMPGSNGSGVGGHDTHADAHESAQSPIPADVEAELCEEARDLYREFLGIGLPEPHARRELERIVEWFVQDFKPDGLLAEPGKRLNRDLGPESGVYLPARGFWRMQEQDRRAGRHPGGVHRFALGEWGPRRNPNGGGPRPLTRGDLQAVENITGKSSRRVGVHDGSIGPQGGGWNAMRGYFDRNGGTRGAGHRPSLRWPHSYPLPQGAQRRGWSRMR